MIRALIRAQDQGPMDWGGVMGCGFVHPQASGEAIGVAMITTPPCRRMAAMPVTSQSVSLVPPCLIAQTPRR